VSKDVPVAVVTGSSGLIGSEAVEFLDARGYVVHGIDNNMPSSAGPLQASTTSSTTSRLITTSHRLRKALFKADRGVYDWANGRCGGDVAATSHGWSAARCRDCGPGSRRRGTGCAAVLRLG
jgi:nucleoside-diphosphate-sugar epimerase